MSNLFGSGQGKTVSTQAVRAQGIQVQTSSYGMGLPVVYGRARVPGTLIWYGDFQSVENTQQVGKGGGGGGQNVTYTYSSSFQLALCEGPVTSLGKIWQDSGLVSLSDINGTFSTGTASQAAWSHLGSPYNLHYPYTAWVGCVNLKLGSSPTAPNFNFEVNGLLQFNPGGGIYDAEPSAIVTDILTSTTHGIGFKYLGDLTIFGNYCKANNIFISPVIDQQTSLMDQLTSLLQITNSNSAWSNGKVVIIPYSDQSATANGVTYTPPTTIQANFGPNDYIKRGVKITRKPLADQYNVIRLEWVDPTNNYVTSVAEAKDQADIDGSSLRQTETIEAHCITNSTLAQLVAQQILQRSLYIRNQYRWTTNLKYVALEPGDVVILTDPRVKLIEEPVRIIQITEAQGDTLEFTAEEFPAGVAVGATQTIEPAAGYSPNVTGVPDASQPLAIFRAPQFLVDGDMEIWMGVCGSGTNWGGANVLASWDNITYTKIGTVHPGCRYGTLTAALATSAVDPDVTNSCNLGLEGAGSLNGGSVSETDNLSTLTLIDQELIAYSAVVLNGDGTYTIGAPLSPPSAPILGDVAGGTFSVNTYYVKVTYVTPGGGETTPSVESSHTVPADRLLTVTSPVASGSATGYNIYASTTSGTETKQNSSPIAIGTGWTKPTSGLVSGSALPAVNHSGYLRRGCYQTGIAAHAIGAPWMRIDDNFFRWKIDPSLVGTTVYIKIQPWNLYGGGLVSEASLTPTTYVIGAGAEIPDTPPTPTFFMATGTSNGVLLQWSNPIPAAVDITSVEYSSNGTVWNVLGQVKGTSYTHVFSGNTTYYYRIRSGSPHFLWSGYSSVLTQAGGSLDFVDDGTMFQRAQVYGFGNNTAVAGWVHAGTLILNPSNSAKFIWSTGGGSSSGGGQQCSVTVNVRAGNGATGAPNLSGISAWQEGGSRGLLNALDGAAASIALVATNQSTSQTNTSWEVYFNCNAHTLGPLEVIVDRASGNSFTFDGTAGTPNTSVSGSYIEVLGISRADGTGAIVTDGVVSSAMTDVVVGKDAGPISLSYSQSTSTSECAIGVGPYSENMEVILTASVVVTNSGSVTGTIYVQPFGGCYYATEYERLVLAPGDVVVFMWETEITLPAGKYVSEGANGVSGSPCNFYIANQTSGSTFSINNLMQKIEVIKR